MAYSSHVFSDEHIQHQKFTNWESRASTEQELMRPRLISEEFCSCLFDQHDDMFNSNIFEWDQTPSEFEDMETRSSANPKASAMMHLTPATTAQRTKVNREAEPTPFDFDFDAFDMDLFNMDCEPASPCSEPELASPCPEPEPAFPCSEPANCVPLIKKPKKRKAEMTRSRSWRKRPFKNVREQRRRAAIKDKLAQLDDLCSSDAVACIVPRPSAEAALIMGDRQRPRKMDILCDSIHIFDVMDKELTKLRSRNKELKKNTFK